MRAALLASSLLFAACSSTQSPAANQGPAPGTGFRLEAANIALAAGDEKYVCFTATLAEAEDVAVTKFASHTTGAVHHFEVFQTLSPEQAGLFDCGATLIKDSWLPLFGAGAGIDNGFTLPDGAGFQLPKNAQLLLQLHLLNATTQPQNIDVTVDLTYAKDATKVTPAGIYALGSMNINLPPQTKNIVVSSPQCALTRDYDVFAVQPHMHQLGTKIAFQTGATAATMTTAYQRDPWLFGSQPIDTFDLTLHAGDFVGATCTYDNGGDNAVGYGESTKDEMCYFVLFYTPFDHLNGCVS